MLVLANGAFKSGSTWLREIVRTCDPSIPSRSHSNIRITLT